MGAAGLIVLVVFASIAWSLLLRVTIFEHERGVVYRSGRLRGLLEPGRHWLPRFSTQVTKVDIRPRWSAITGQEVLTSDGVSVKVSLAAHYAIADPAAAVTRAQNLPESLHLTLQLALREVVSAGTIDALLGARQEMAERLHQLTVEPARELGLDLKTVNLRDLTFPGELKKVFAQVVHAQKEGQAALEKARGETAALRQLANAARMVDGNPSLMQLRLLQQLSVSRGNTVVLGMPLTSTPLPLQAPLPDTDHPPTLAGDPG